MMTLLRLIQWRFVLPRLAIAAAAALGTWLAVEPLLQRFLVGIGERIIRAKVDIDGIDVALSTADLTLTGVEVANPRSLDRNLIECEVATFDIVPSSVLQRRMEVREARLSGVRFNTPRSKSGEVKLPPLPGVCVPDDLDTMLKGLSNSALRQFTRIIAQDLQDELISLQLSRQLAARWPEEYRQLEARAAQFAERVAQIQAELESIDDNRPGIATSFPERVAEVERLKQEVLALGKEMDRITEQALRDRDAIAIAQQHDHEVIRRKLTLRPLDPQALSEYLLGEELTEQTREMIGWIKLARRYWPSDLELPEAERSHGEDIVFPGLKPLPRAIVNKLRLDGTILSGNQSVAWRGEILNLTTEPALTGQPMQIRAETLGDQQLTIHATLDRTTNIARDRIVLSLPALKQPQRTLGNPEQLTVAIAPGKVHVWAELNLEGEKLSGRMLLQQPDLQISTQLSPKLGERLGARVQAATSHVQTLQAEVKLAGTLDKPHWELRSNLGPQLATSLHQALQAELDVRCVELTAILDNFLAAEQGKLTQLLATEQQKVTDKIAAGALEIEGLRRQVAGRIQLPGLGQRDDLPFSNPFTRR